MTKCLTPPEVAQTQADRPHARLQKPFTFKGDGRGRQLIYRKKLWYDRQGKEMLTGEVIINFDDIHFSDLCEQCLELQTYTCKLESEQDGYIKRIDDLIAEKVMLERQIEEMINKDKYAASRKAKETNGTKG